MSQQMLSTCHNYSSIFAMCPAAVSMKILYFVIFCLFFCIHFNFFVGDGAVDAFHNLSVTFGDGELHTESDVTMLSACAVLRKNYKIYSWSFGDGAWIKLEILFYIKYVTFKQKHKNFLKFWMTVRKNIALWQYRSGVFLAQVKHTYPLLSKQA